MKPVRQEETTGCGLASVAAISGRTYTEVKTLANSLGIFADDIKLFSETAYVRKLLRHYNFDTSSEEIPFESWEALPDTALLATKYHHELGKPFWHWVVFNRSHDQPVILDSAAMLECNLRTDFNTIKPEWYITVTG